MPVVEQDLDIADEARPLRRNGVCTIRKPSTMPLGAPARGARDVGKERAGGKPAETAKALVRGNDDVSGS